MRRVLSLVTVFTFLLSLSLSSTLVSAAPSSTGSRLSATRLQEVGDTVTVPNIEGEEIGTVTVEDLEEGFEGFEEDTVAGLQYVSILLVIENTSDDPIAVDPGNIGLIDDSGLIYVDIDVTREDGEDEIELTDIEPGDTLEGYLEIGFPEESEIAYLVWIAGQGQIPTLINNADPIEEGDEVTLFSEDYEEQAIITTEEVTVDFDDFEEGLQLNDDYRFIGAEITVENTGTDDLVLSPESFFIAASDGVFWTPDTSLIRSEDAIDEVPDFTDEPIAPGDTVSGYVTWSILADQEVGYIFYLPDGFRLVHLFDAEVDDDNGGLGPLGRDEDETVTPDDDETVTPEADETPRTSSGDDCEGAAEYAESTIAGLGDWSEALQSIDFRDPDLDIIQEAIDISLDLAEEQADLEVPPAAEELNDLLVAAYEDTADALQLVHDGITEGDAALVGDGAAAIGEIAESLTEGEIADALVEAEDACPDLSDL